MQFINAFGGYGFFSKKNILIPKVAEKNILILVEGKKKSDSEFSSIARNDGYFAHLHI
jgi:hypothetical protein